MSRTGKDPSTCEVGGGKPLPCDEKHRCLALRPGVFSLVLGMSGTGKEELCFSRRRNGGPGHAACSPHGCASWSASFGSGGGRGIDVSSSGFLLAAVVRQSYAVAAMGVAFIPGNRKGPMGPAVLTKAVCGNDDEVLRSFFDRSGMCMARLDSAMLLTEANVDFSRKFGCVPAELNGTCFSDLLHQDARTTVDEQFTRLLAEEHYRFTEPMITFQQKDSAIFNGELTAFIVRGDGGGIDSLMALIYPEDRGANGRPATSHKLLLTEVDVRILEGVAAGVSTVELASVLYLSRGGVEYHVDTLMRKLKVNNRPALVSKAYFMGVLCPGVPPRVHPDYLKLAGHGRVGDWRPVDSCRAHGWVNY